MYGIEGLKRHTKSYGFLGSVNEYEYRGCTIVRSIGNRFWFVVSCPAEIAHKITVGIQGHRLDDVCGIIDADLEHGQEG